MQRLIFSHSRGHPEYAVGDAPMSEGLQSYADTTAKRDLIPVKFPTVDIIETCPTLHIPNASEAGNRVGHNSLTYTCYKAKDLSGQESNSIGISDALR